MHTKPLDITANGKPQIIFDIHFGGHLWPPINRNFLQIMWKVSDQQNQHAEATGASTQLANTGQAVAIGGHGFYGTIAPVTMQ